MRLCRIYSYKYGLNISDILINRLTEQTSNFSVYKKENTCLEIGIDEKETEKLIAAICEVMIYDLSQFELADMINEIDIDLSIKRTVLLSSVGYARKAAMKSPVRHALASYFEENDTLVLEGFIMFRMQDTREIWERCIEKALEDVVLEEEQIELAALIYELLRTYPGQRSEAVLMLRKDGSCTVVDDKGTHIDYPDGLGIMNILFSISPETITIYDMTGDPSCELITAVQSAFPGKVKVFSSLRKT